MKITMLEKSGNYKDTLKILKENGLQPLTYQEAFMHRAEIVKAFKGQYKWFWILGKGLDKSGYHTIDKFGDVRAGKGAVEDTVYLWFGSNPLSFYVHSDGSSASFGRRFLLNANFGPNDVAPVVVGKPLSKRGLSETKHKHRFVCGCGKVGR